MGPDKKIFGTVALALVMSLPMHAQQAKPLPKGTPSASTVAHSEILASPFMANIQMVQPENDLNPRLMARAIYHPEPNGQNEPANIVAPSPAMQVQDAGRLSAAKSGADDPVVVHSFFGYSDYNYVPPDNSVAVSDDGLVLSVMNSNLRVFDAAGKQLFFSSFHGIFLNNVSGLTGNIYDPRAIYDPVSDRFIVVVLHGNTPSTSKVLMMFSKTKDPRDGWNLYSVPGNIGNQGLWFDFPSIGISNDELFITGNLFNSSNYFMKAVILQVNKMDGYNGLGSLRYQYWEGFNDASGEDAFTVVPASYGIEGSYGPGIYLVSTEGQFGGNMLTLYDITNNMAAPDEKLNTYSFNFPFTYQRPRLVSQKSSTQQLNAQDTRVHGAFFLGNTIHFVFTSRSTSNTVVYSRLNVETQKIDFRTFGLASFDYCFPSIASLANDEHDKTVAIGFLSSSVYSYPDIRTVICRDDMSFTNSTLVQQGLGAVNALNDNIERWGDYMTIARKYNDNSCIVVGSYGSNQKWFTQIAEISNPAASGIAEEPAPEASQVSVYPNPVVNSFSVDFELKNMAWVNIRLYDAAGRMVRVLYAQEEKPGQKSFAFNRAALPQGIYYIDITAGDQPLLRERLVVE